MNQISTGARDAASINFERRLLGHVDALFNRALDLCDSEEEAAELVVETCVRAWRGFRNDPARTPRKAWLFATMFSIATNERPQARGGPELGAMRVPEGGFLQEFESMLAEGDTHWIGQREYEWGDGGIVEILRELPGELRMPLVLVDVDGLTYEDAARVLRCSVGSLQSRLFQARRAMFVKLSRIVRNAGQPGPVGHS